MRESNSEPLEISDIELIFHTFSTLLLLSLLLGRGSFSAFNFLLFPIVFLASTVDSRAALVQQNFIADQSPGYSISKEEPTSGIAHSVLTPVDYDGGIDPLAIAEDMFEILYKCSGPVNSIKMADVVLLGEAHDDRWHRKLVNGIRGSFDFPGYCWLSEGLQYSILSPWDGYNHWRRTGWEDMSLPTWIIYNVSRDAYNRVRDFYYQNVTAEIELEAPSNCTALSTEPQKGIPLSVLLNMTRFPEFNSIYSLGNRNQSLAFLMEINERA